MKTNTSIFRDELILSMMKGVGDKMVATRIVCITADDICSHREVLGPSKSTKPKSPKKRGPK